VENTASVHIGQRVARRISLKAPRRARIRLEVGGHGKIYGGIDFVAAPHRYGVKLCVVGIPAHIFTPGPDSHRGLPAQDDSPPVTHKERPARDCARCAVCG